MCRIEKVMPVNDYCMEVKLDNGDELVVDFTCKLHTIRFGLLSDKAFFKTAVTDGVCIRWGNKIEMSVGEVLCMEQA